MRAISKYKEVALNNWMSHFGTITHKAALHKSEAVRFSIDITSLLQTHGSKVQRALVAGKL